MSEGEQEQLATLETLEQSLLSQGFVPLQPGALSTIAQESGIATTSTPASIIEALPESPIEPAPPQGTVPLADAATHAEQPWWNSAPFQADAPETPGYTP